MDIDVNEIIENLPNGIEEFLEILGNEHQQVLNSINIKHVVPKLKVIGEIDSWLERNLYNSKPLVDEVLPHIVWFKVGTTPIFRINTKNKQVTINTESNLHSTYNALFSYKIDKYVEFLTTKLKIFLKEQGYGKYKINFTK